MSIQFLLFFNTVFNLTPSLTGPCESCIDYIKCSQLEPILDQFPDSIESTYRNIIDYHCKNTRHSFYKTNDSILNKYMDTVINRHLKLLNEHPEFYPSLLEKGFYYFERYNKELALKNFEEVLTYNDTFPMALYFNGLVHFEFGNYDESIALLRESNRYNKDHNEILQMSANFLSALIKLHQHQPDSAFYFHYLIDWNQNQNEEFGFDRYQEILDEDSVYQFSMYENLLKFLRENPDARFSESREPVWGKEKFKKHMFYRYCLNNFLLTHEIELAEYEKICCN